MGLLDDLKDSLSSILNQGARGSGPKLLPGRKGPTTGELYQYLAQIGAEMGPVPSVERFVNRPGFKTGAEAFLGLGGGAVGAVALPIKGRRSPNLLKYLNHQADADRIMRLGDQGPENLDNVHKMIAGLPLYEGGKVRRGRTYRLDPTKVRKGGGYTNDIRLAVIQDPDTGAMFVSPGDFHHGELMQAAYKAGYRNKGVRKATKDGIPYEPGEDYKAWMQHEIWGPQEFPGKSIPGKVNWHNKRGGPFDPVDSRSATFGRIRLVQNLARAGIQHGKDTTKVPDAQSVLKKWGIRSPRSPAKKFPDFKPAKKNYGPKDFQ